ncbi:MAG: SagB/ThcOx family dehydrogenase [Thermosphaera sp.]
MIRLSPTIPLPPPSRESCLGKLLSERRSVRIFTATPLTLSQLSTILWAAYGCIDPECGRRTSPSAGATYPFEIYVSVKSNGVEELKPGILHYDAKNNGLTYVAEGDYSNELARACLRQRWVLNAPVNLILVAFTHRTTEYYGERGVRYIFNEAGHIGQNIYLATTEMGLGTVAVGAFKDEEVAKLLKLSKGAMPVYIFPIGRTR